MRFASARSSGWSSKRTITSRGERYTCSTGTVVETISSSSGPSLSIGVRLARAHVRGRVRLELVRLALQLERAPAGDDEEELVAALLAPRQRAPRRVAGDVLLEQLRAGVGAHDDLLEGGVSLGPAPFDVLLGDHEGVPHRRNLTCSPVSCQ